METLTVGSKETLFVDVEDLLENLTDLSAAAPRYDVKDKLGNYKLQNLIPIVQAPQLLRAQCLIDTTVGGNWTPGHYFLYIRFTANPDAPVLGPLEFKVNP